MESIIDFESLTTLCNKVLINSIIVVGFLIMKNIHFEK